MSGWGAANLQGGINFENDMFHLLDLRFVDDALIFADTMEGCKIYWIAPCDIWQPQS